MSADLFAEFNELSSTPTPPLPTVQQPQKPNVQSLASDPFNFSQQSQFSAPATVQQPQWPSFQTQSSSPSMNMSGWGAVAQPPAAPSQPADDDDGWGDFEVAEPVAPQATVPAQMKGWGVPDPILSQTANLRPQMVRPSTLDIMTNNLVEVQRQPEPQFPPPRYQSSPTPQLVTRPPPKDDSVLFDADDFELQGGEYAEDNDDDDFGDFETVPAPPSQPKSAIQWSAPLKSASTTAPLPSRALKSAPSMDLLSLDDSPEPEPQPVAQSAVPARSPRPLSFGAIPSKYPEPSKSPLSQDWNTSLNTTSKVSASTAPKSKQKMSHTKTASSVSMSSSRNNGLAVGSVKPSFDDDWGAWDDGPSNAGKDVKVDHAEPSKSWDWETTDESTQPQTKQGKDDEPPPLNVPPPSVILSVFPSLLSSGDSLFKSMAGQNASVKQQILTNPKTVQFLQGYVLLVATAARVIAGRKHRWHRDKILAKSMSISAAGSKGMKLTGVDKTQSVREDREAADVVAVWRDHVGRLRSAVAAANAAGKTSLKVPELSDSMQVQTAKMVPTAPKACIICGLKREERVAKVDVEVEDSFGEWWVDHWGHRACKNFWIEHEQNLRQR